MDFAFDPANFRSLKSKLDSLKPKSKTTISQSKSILSSAHEASLRIGVDPDMLSGPQLDTE